MTFEKIAFVVLKGCSGALWIVITNQHIATQFAYGLSKYFAVYVLDANYGCALIWCKKRKKRRNATLLSVWHKWRQRQKAADQSQHSVPEWDWWFLVYHIEAWWHIYISKFSHHWLKLCFEWCAFGAKPLPEPVIICCQLDPHGQI